MFTLVDFGFRAECLWQDGNFLATNSMDNTAGKPAHVGAKSLWAPGLLDGVANAGLRDSGLKVRFSICRTLRL